MIAEVVLAHECVMTVPTTGHAFLELITKSRLLTQDQVDAFLCGLSLPLDALTAMDLAGCLVQDRLLTHFQVYHLLKGRHNNLVIGDYAILAPLGSSGTTHVFLGQSREKRHKVTLKMLPYPHRSAFPGQIAGISDVIGQRIPHVAELIAFQEIPNRYCYAIGEYLEGISLLALVDRLGPLPLPQVMEFGVQLARGLVALEERRLVHGHIKPSNILIDLHGRLSYLDLGLALDSTTPTPPGQSPVAPEVQPSPPVFQAPETLGHPAVLNARSDQFSLGATLVYLSTGHSPGDSHHTPWGTVPNWVGLLPPARKSNRQALAVLERMLATNPDERFPDATTLLEHLHPWSLARTPPIDLSFVSEVNGMWSATTPTLPMPLRGDDTVVAPALQATRGRGLHIPPVQAEAPVPERTTSTPAGRKRRRVRAAGMTLAVMTLVVGIAAMSGVLPFNHRSADAPVTADATLEEADASADVIVVSAQGATTSIAEALKRIPPGGTILLAGKEHRETLQIDTPPPGVTIRSSNPDSPVRWYPHSMAPVEEPIITIRNAGNLTLAHCILDGDLLTHTALSIQGSQGGMAIQNLLIEDVRQTGIILDHCQGEPARKLSLTQVKITGNGHGLVVGPGGAKHVLMDQCQLLDPLRYGVELRGPTGDFSITNSHFHELAVAIRSVTPDPCQLLIQHNSMIACRYTALQLLHMPEEVSHWEVTNNLFVKTPRLMTTAEVSGHPQIKPPAWIWHPKQPLPPPDPMAEPAPSYFVRVWEAEAGSTPKWLDLGSTGSCTVWINGQRVAQRQAPLSTQRVERFPIDQVIRPGKNVIAIEAQPYAARTLSHAGIVVRLMGERGAEPNLTTDSKWHASHTQPQGWPALTALPENTHPVQVWNTTGRRYPWSGAVWEASLQAHEDPTGPLRILTSGNVRDKFSMEGHPSLETIVMTVRPPGGMKAHGLRTLLKQAAGAQHILSAEIPAR